MNGFCFKLSSYSENQNVNFCHLLIWKIIKSNERGRDSYIGFADFFLFFFQEKSKSLITTDVHSYILMHL